MRTPYVAKSMHELLSLGISVGTATLQEERARQEACEECMLPECRRCPSAASNEVREMSVRVGRKIADGQRLFS